MTKFSVLIVFLLQFLNENVCSQQTSKLCNCCTQEYKQFDFWLGEWEVYNKKGEQVGSNSIVSIQDSCLIQENWTSKQETGTSYTYYNKIDSSWNQIYIDNLGTVLQLKGSFQNNRMILQSERVKSKKANFYYFNRIIWEKDNQGNVSQKWDIVNDKGEVLQVAFDGIYKPIIK